MKSRKLQAEHGLICRVSGERLGYFGWPTLARMGDGTLVVASSGLRQWHICPYGKTVLNFSRDDGRNWSWPRVIHDAAIDVRDAGIVWLGGSRLLASGFGFDPRRYWTTESHRKAIEGRFKSDPEGLAFWRLKTSALDEPQARNHPTAWVQFSDDGGENWHPPIPTPVSSPHGPILLSRGRLLYLGKQAGAPQDMHGGPILAAASDDGGRTWQILSTLPNYPAMSPFSTHEPHAVELPDGRIVGMIRIEDWVQSDQDIEHRVAQLGLTTFSILQTESADGGKTWTTPRPLGFHGCPPHLLRHSSGTLVLSYGYRMAPFGQRIALSRDSGATWDHDWILRDDGPSGDLGYPSTVEMADGSLMTAYYQQASRANENCSLFWSRWRLP